MVCLWYNVIQVVKKQFERNAGEKNMKKILDLITGEVTQAFVDCGYDAKYGKVTLSNRPDLCEYQCNGAMAAAKEYKKAPFMIADEVAEKLSGNAMFSMVESVKPGFLNLKLDEAYLADYVAKMQADEGRYGCEKTKEPKTIMIDYGGPNVAKPLHVGHLRSAIIGESIKRIGRFMGHTVIGDVHLGDWGLQMGLIIAQVQSEHPELCYFDPNFTGEYPTLVVHNLDQPGHVTEVTAMLAKARINIATMQLYRSARGGDAVMVLECDQEVPEQIVHRLEQLSGIKKVTYLSLV